MTLATFEDVVGKLEVALFTTVRAVDPSPFFMVAFVVELNVVFDLGNGCCGCSTRVESTLRRAVQSVTGITVGNLDSSFLEAILIPLRTVACPGVLRGSADVTEVRAARAAEACQ